MKIHKTTPMTCVLFCILYFNEKLIQKFRYKAQAWQVTRDPFLSLLLEKKGLALQSTSPVALARVEGA